MFRTTNTHSKIAISSLVPSLLLAFSLNQNALAIEGCTLTPTTAPTSNKMLLTEVRLTDIKANVTIGFPAYETMQAKLNANINESTIYNQSEFALSYLLSYYINENPAHLSKAIELFKGLYVTGYEGGWQHYKIKNSFRSDLRYAALFINWIGTDLPIDTREQALSNFAIWGEYWLDHVDFENNFDGFRAGDTDHTTSLAEAFSMLGIVLQGTEIGARLLEAGDCLTKRFVIDDFFEGIMAGGIWGEGTYYSPGTEPHWISQSIFNREVRGIVLDQRYIENTILARLHLTIPGKTALHWYGDAQDPTDYINLGAHRYTTPMTWLGGATTNEQYKKLAHRWVADVFNQHGIYDNSIYTHIWRVMFEDPKAIQDQSLNLTPQQANLDTEFFAAGLDYFTSRSSWGDDATAFYFTSNRFEVDHQHADALSFDIARKGAWLTKEVTGYWGASYKGRAHNTLLIENADDYGSSNPMLRAAADGDVLETSSSPRFTYASADATQVYNMSGYYQENYTKQATRQILFLKPDAFVVFDHISTDKTRLRDMRQNNKLPSDVTEHVRWTKYIQHFQTQPTLKNDHYYSSTEGQEIYFKTVLPENAATVIVDEKALYADIANWKIPENQKKWNIEVQAPTPTEENEYLSLIFLGDEDKTILPLSTTVLSAADNSITNDVAAKGIALEYTDKVIVAFFPTNPNETLAEIHYDLGALDDVKPVEHFILGVGNNSYRLSYTANDTSTDYRIGATGSQAVANVGGAITFLTGAPSPLPPTNPTATQVNN